MAIKLVDSELKVMNVIWRLGEPTAKQVAEILQAEVGWNVNTTYTLIKRCINKGAVQREEPHFQCRALIDKAAVQAADGSADQLFAALLGRKQLTEEKLAELREIVGDWQ